MRNFMQDIAFAVRMGDLAKAEAALDVLFYQGNADVIEGRAKANRALGRTKPLPPLSEPMDLRKEAEPIVPRPWAKRGKAKAA
jgi:hypothetical protein